MNSVPTETLISLYGDLSPPVFPCWLTTRSSRPRPLMCLPSLQFCIFCRVWQCFSQLSPDRVLRAYCGQDCISCCCCSHTWPHWSQQSEYLTCGVIFAPPENRKTCKTGLKGEYLCRSF